MRILRKAGIVFLVTLITMQSLAARPVYAIGSDPGSSDPTGDGTDPVTNEEYTYGNTDGIDYNYSDFEGFKDQFTQDCSTTNIYYYDYQEQTGTRQEDNHEFINLISDVWSSWSSTNYYTSGHLSPISGKQFEDEVKDLLVQSRKEYRYNTRNEYSIYTYKQHTGTYEQKPTYKYKKWVTSGHDVNYMDTCTGYKWTYKARSKSYDPVVGYEYYCPSGWSTYYSSNFGTYRCKKYISYTYDCEKTMWADTSHYEYTGYTDYTRSSPYILVDTKNVNDTSRPIYLEYESQTAPVGGVKPGTTDAYVSQRTELSSWSGWGAWSTSYLTETNLRDRQVRTRYRYRNYLTVMNSGDHLLQENVITVPVYTPRHVEVQSAGIPAEAPLDNKEWIKGTSVCIDKYSLGGNDYTLAELQAMYNAVRNMAIVLKGQDYTEFKKGTPVPELGYYTSNVEEVKHYLKEAPSPDDEYTFVNTLSDLTTSVSNLEFGEYKIKYVATNSYGVSITLVRNVK